MASPPEDAAASASPGWIAVCARASTLRMSGPRGTSEFPAAQHNSRRRTTSAQTTETRAGGHAERGPQPRVRRTLPATRAQFGKTEHQATRDWLRAALATNTARTSAAACGTKGQSRQLRTGKDSAARDWREALENPC